MAAPAYEPLAAVPLGVTRLAIHLTSGDGLGYLWQDKHRVGVRWVQLPDWGFSVPREQAWDFPDEETAIWWWEKCVTTSEAVHGMPLRLVEPGHVRN